MPAGYTELFMEQGATYTTSLNLDDVSGTAFNLTEYSPTAQMRKSYYSANATATFVCDTGVDATLGIVNLSLDASNTANIKAGRYVYDVILTKNDTRIRVLEGIVNVTPQVTQT
jgi:hypothetical protein